MGDIGDTTFGARVISVQNPRVLNKLYVYHLKSNC